MDITTLYTDITTLYNCIIYGYNYIIYAKWKVFQSVKLKNNAVTVESLNLVQYIKSFLTEFLHIKLWLIRLSYISAIAGKHCGVSRIIYTLNVG
jgi:threonine/homoserine/homoserine lactone efflux protein